MKKLVVLLLAIVPIVAFSQIKPGRYIIKSAINDRALHFDGNRITIQETCPDYNVDCQNQIWEIKSVRGQRGLFTMQAVYNRKLLTFNYMVNRNQILDDTFMEASKPLASIRTQSFFIQDAGDGKYTIQPNVAVESDLKDPSIDVYLSARLSNINSGRGDVLFEYKNQALNPQHYNDLSNIYFKFFPLPLLASRVAVAPKLNNVQQSGSVIVAPKSDNKLDVDLKTGADNLEVKSFQENLEIRIIIQNHADIIILNANKNQTWPSNSIRRISFPLPPDITADAIKEIQIYRKQLGSADNFKATTADNWDLQSISATATLVTNGVKTKTEFEKMVTTRRGKPLFRFIYERGDNEYEGTVCKKTFAIKTTN